jgi:ribA/ribD-fused uncharacterized protein
MIGSFAGPWRFLSNFHPCLIQAPDGITYPSVEHAYQAQKTNLRTQKEAIRLARTAGQAKRLGRSLCLLADWDDRRIPIMEALLRQKFADPDLAARLDATGKLRLIEGNTWGDRFWGQCPVGQGSNHLGKLLMKIREELRATSN